MRLFLTFFLLTLSGCATVPPDLSAPSLTIPANYAQPPSGTPNDTDRWWLAFGDSTLNNLAGAGLAGNLDISQAMSRLAAAEANTTVAGAGGLPTLNFGLSRSHTLETGDLKTTDGMVTTSTSVLSSSWLIDLFGEFRAQSEGARAQRNAALAGTDIARLTLLSSLASSYVDARHYQERVRIERSTLAAYQSILALTTKMRSAGIASDLTVAQAQEQVQRVMAAIPALDAAFLQSAHRIATLTGQPAGTYIRLLQQGGPQPVPSWSAQVGVPADLIRLRPDIRRAESELASAMADIGVAQAQLFPAITLSGSITPTFLNSNAASGGLTTWSFGPSLRLPIFDGGKLMANVAIAIARAREKQDRWKSTVLVGIEEVESALVRYDRNQKTLSLLLGRLTSAQRALDLSNAAYIAGELSLLDIVEARTALYTAQADLADTRRNLSLAFIALNVAAGRGLSR